jgi:hypothetical protein
MSNPDTFRDAPLPGGYVLSRLEFVEGPLVDAIGRPALAKTQILGRQIRLSLVSTLDEKETSVSLYHEILEAMTIAIDDPPERVRDFNESDFEIAGYAAFDRFGEASPVNLIRMLQSYGFREE